MGKLNTAIWDKDSNLRPVFSYWESTSRFWAVMRKLGYKGHRGQSYIKGLSEIEDTDRTFWSDSRMLKNG